jgi:hypothetical protein
MRRHPDLPVISISRTHNTPPSAQCEILTKPSANY